MDVILFAALGILLVGALPAAVAFCVIRAIGDASGADAWGPAAEEAVGREWSAQAASRWPAAAGKAYAALAWLPLKGPGGWRSGLVALFFFATVWLALANGMGAMCNWGAADEASYPAAGASGWVSGAVAARTAKERDAGVAVIMSDSGRALRLRGAGLLERDYEKMTGKRVWANAVQGRLLELRAGPGFGDAYSYQKLRSAATSSPYKGAMLGAWALAAVLWAAGAFACYGGCAARLPGAGSVAPARAKR